MVLASYEEETAVLDRRTLLAGAGLAIAGSFLAPSRSWAQSQERKRKIAIGILGQSNEQNRVPPGEITDYPDAFRSKNNPAVFAPQTGNLIVPLVRLPETDTTKTRHPYGGMWFSMYDALWDWGYDCTMVNGAIGSASMVRDIVGAVSPWLHSNNGYFENRPPLAKGDRGHTGSFVIKGTPQKIFRCVRGIRKYSMLDGAPPLPGTSIDTLDYIATQGDARSGRVEPDWDRAKAKGDTIEDGDLLWTYERLNDTGLADSVTGKGVCSAACGGAFWDPLGIVGRLEEMMEAIKDVQEKWIILQNGQSDYGDDVRFQSAYATALVNLSQYLVGRGYKVAIGLSCFTPTQSTKKWDGLQDARNVALRALNEGAAGSRIQPGANLYGSLGPSIEELLQPDKVHLNARGAIKAGKLWGEAFKAFLPKYG